MHPPPNSPDVATAKMRLQAKQDRMEEILNQYVAEVANAGFTDRRLAAMARSKFEEGFLLLGKALRINASTTEYGKVPGTDPIPADFSPRVDDQIGVAPIRRIDRMDDDGV